MPDRLIELKDVAKSYGRVFAVGGVNFHVDRGEVVGLIGDNGAGKSTLIKMLAGAIQPTSGQIFARGVLQTKTMSAQHRILEAIAHLVDNGTLKTTMTENYGVINASNLRRAHKAVEAGSVRGKIVLEGF